MENRIFVSEGLSQQARKFKELAKAFVAVNNMTLQQLLEEICKYEKQHDCPLVINENDIPKLAKAIESDSDGNTEPAAALYTVFAKLLNRVQERLNDLPSQRIDFYFRKILGERPNKAHGDHAHVIFPIELRGFKYKLPKGTRFIAGTNEDGETIEFESVSKAELNDIQVEKIYTLAVPEKGVSTVSEIPVYKPSQAIEIKDMVPYPLFGMTRSGDRAANSEFTRLGLAISSRLLYLNDGIRQIKVKLIYEAESVKGTLLECGQAPELFLKVFANAFRISLSTADGWYDVDGYQLESHILDAHCEENCIGLTLQLSDMAPAIVNCDPTIHGAEYNLNGPAMRIIVLPHASYNPWETLKNLKLRKVLLQVRVTNCKRLALSNDIGPLSMNAPIQPFGPLPAVGNSLVVGCEEIRGKRLSSFEIHGNWRGLPRSRDFSYWYKQYPNAPLTRDFKVSVSALLGGYWSPFNTQTPLLQDLFQSESDAISNKLTISCDKALGGRTFEQQYDSEDFEYTPNSRDGFFKIKLVSPENAFMHQEYSKVLCGNLMQQALKKNLGKELELPNQPYTPELENLSVSYTAAAEINLRSSDNSDGKILFLRPWGVSEKSHLQLEGGALFLGLTPTVNTNSVNLYFHLNRDSDNIHEDGEIGFIWAYLGVNGWTRIPSENILYNTTANFTTSGIVSITIPKDFTTDSSLMPKGLCWIRLEPQGNWNHCSRLFSVYAQAVEVVRSKGFGQKNTFKHCKPGCINELAQSISGLSAVYQLEESFSGEPEEDREEMQTRVAEYLYHRNRILTARDCERMILEEFPEVHLVKCFAGLSPEKPNQASAGHILVVPVSPLYEDGRHIWDPRLSGKTLEDIKQFVKQKSSPFAKITVMNPQFERIQVRCNVDFINDNNDGEHLQDLNKQINNYLSPWNSDSSSRFFGWSLNKEHLRMFIQNLPYVEEIQDFSVLRISSKDRSEYSMEESDKASNNYIHGTTPWSILTPMKRHFLNVIEKNEDFRDITVGYGDLEIGSTFIIQRRNNG
ncbi:hypothetical protein [Fibrobacter sp.]|uniref:hypothetical protein n=1 Tax=Fibrobacter sp. TaxID=35828 RepID=UPI003868C6B4